MDYPTLEIPQEVIEKLSSLKEELFGSPECGAFDACSRDNSSDAICKNKNCPLCRCKLFLKNKMPHLLSLTSCLCQTFGHNYCQGLLGYVPSDFAKKHAPNVKTKNIPTHKCCRLMLKLMANDYIKNGYNSFYSLEDIILSIFAWGGQTITMFGNVTRWSSWLANSRNISNLSADIISQSININTFSFSGVGITFASKLLFFFDASNSNVIFDSNVQKVIKSLFKINFYSYQYNNYNLFITRLTTVLNLPTPELTEILLWNYGARLKTKSSKCI